jgi:PAS domain S-box-containing protein
VTDSPHRRNRDSDTGEAVKPPRLRRGLLIYAATLLAIAWSYGLWQISVDRAITLESSEHQLTLSATAFSNHVTAMINDGVGAAMAAANQLRSSDTKRPIADTQMTAVLGRMLTGGEYVRTLFIATPTRYAAAHRDHAQDGDPRPAFLSEMLATTDATWVGQPLNIEQGDANVVIPIAERVAELDGETTWVGTMLSFATLDALYRTLPVEHSGLALSHRAGTLLVRVPTLPGFKFAGTNLADYDSTKEYLRQPAGPLVSYVAPDPFSGNPRQFVVRRMEKYPIRTTASRDIGNSLLGWRTRTRNSLFMLAVGSIALVALTISLIVALQRRFEAVQRSEERFQLAVAGSNDGIWDWDVKTNRVYYSPRIKEQLGVAPDEEFPPTQESFYSRMHPDDVKPIQDAVRRHLLQREPYDVEYRVRARGGDYRWVRARAQATWNERGEYVRMAGSITDIHDKHMAEAALEEARTAELHAREEFAQHLLSAQEQERQRLANELHDSVGQTLSLVKNRALLALQEPGLPPSAGEHLTVLSNLTTDVIAEVRAVAQNLRPLHIEQLGITDALNTLLAQIQNSSPLTIERRIEDIDDALKSDAATHLFRIMQEALNNTLKHAGATHCRVTVERDVRCLRLAISDNGSGFDHAAARRKMGLGLASIAERVRMLGATYRIDTAPGRGTTLHIEIPIEAETADTT